MANALEAVEFRPGQTIFKQGEEGDRFYIIQEGGVTVSTTSAATGEKTLLAKLGEGKFFGERALMRDDPRCAHDPPGSAACAPALAICWCKCSLQCFHCACSIPQGLPWQDACPTPCPQLAG